MRKKREIVSAVEIGSSKICVLIGEVVDGKSVDIIGQGVVSSENSIIKGEVEDVNKAFSLLTKALEQADKASGNRLNEAVVINVLISGCAIESHLGKGTVFIKNEQKKVTELECNEAHENARIFQRPANRDIINSIVSYWMVDDRKVHNPLNHTANKIDAYVHVVHGEMNRVENIRSLLGDAGFETSSLEMTFSPIAADAGVLTDEERKNGVLLIDIGAGCTEYVVECNKGIIDSGVIQVGFQHLYNDLSLGLGLQVDICKKFIESGSVSKGLKLGQDYMEISNSTTGRLKKIPLRSIETIVDARLQEIFEIIRTKLAEKNALASVGSGGVLTGGGAMFDKTEVAFRETFEMICRIGTPLDLTGAITGIDNPRYSAVWGALKLIPLYLEAEEAKQTGFFGNATDALSDLFGNFVQGAKNMKGVFKI